MFVLSIISIIIAVLALAIAVGSSLRQNAFYADTDAELDGFAENIVEIEEFLDETAQLVLLKRSPSLVIQQTRVNITHEAEITPPAVTSFEPFNDVYDPTGAKCGTPSCPWCGESAEYHV